ncbi:ATP synthase-coupling factor 6, mitochondrial isoform X10 [Poecilia latipinna]|uniref:ATP synthase peripheral stalk subunit F6, mitochondrial n=1 Tax=Poecilia latipinna TaxID=48699 RepID=A0A3B3UFX6_9TELE|nr:PREDICTED: ATP synthase-coupling factor 6, mitochondrial-like isoform X10 [Poecilia latipinna]
MSASLLRIGHLRCVNKCLQTEGWKMLSRAPAALPFSTKSSGSKNSSKKTSKAHMDPVQRLFLDSIREYSANSQAAGGLVDADPLYQKALEEETAKLQRLYGGGDLTSFPNFKFTEPQWDEGSQK